MAAAFEAFSERGYEATCVEDVAVLAGVTKGTVYVYFDTKEELFKAMVRHYSSRTLADGEAIFSAMPGTCAERLSALFAFIYDRCAHDRKGRELLRFIVAEAKNFPSLAEEHYRDFVAPAMRMVGKLLLEGAANGEFKPELTPEAAFIAIAPAVFLGTLKLIFSDALQIDEKAYFSAHINQTLNGIMALKASDA